MTRFTSCFALFALASSSLFLTVPAHAAKGKDKAAEKSDPPADDKKADDKNADDDKPAEDKSDASDAKSDSEPAEKKVESSPPTADSDSSPIEQVGKTYQFVGLRYRGIVVPKFMINLFGQGGRTVFVNGFGPEFAVRRDGFEYEFAAWYAPYSMDTTPFKASSDPDQAWELVKSEIKVLYFTADFLWSHDIQPQFAINYGLGAGIGIVWGNLYRNQAYPGAGANATTGDGYLPCARAGDPRDPAAGSTNPYCGSDNNHYGGYTEPSWAGGGSKPILFPWFVLQTGARYKFDRHFVGRLDLGFGTSGFFFGLGGDYGL